MSNGQRKYHELKEKEITESKVLIIGIGNYLMGDEGIGVHFIQYLEKHQISFTQTDILDGGTGGFILLGILEAYDIIIFIDATMDGNAPGTISLIKPKFASDFPNGLTAHDFGLKDLVESMYLLGNAQEMYLFTISIDEIKPMHINLSPEVKSSIPILVDRVRQLISDLLEK